MSVQNTVLIFRKMNKEIKKINKPGSDMFYGPVSSRRFGSSLGVDIIPYKICSYDCIYCQLGRTRTMAVKRKNYKEIDTDVFLKGLRVRLSGPNQPEYITFSGSGEPTLHYSIGKLINIVKKTTDKKVLVLTNGSLLFMDDVKNELLRADAVKISLDATDNNIFKKINRPHESLVFKDIMNGLYDFLKVYKNSIFLEIMFIKGINDNAGALDLYLKIIKKIEKIRPVDTIHINTPERIPAEDFVKKPDPDTIAWIGSFLGKNSDIIKKNAIINETVADGDVYNSIIEMIRVRPSTIVQIKDSFNMCANEALKAVNILLEKGKIKYRHYNGENHYYA